MLGPIRALKSGLVIAATALALLTVSSPSQAASGTVRFTVTKAGFIVGGGGGTGVLHFKGRNYPLQIGGMSLGTIGVARMDVVGVAHNLNTATDIVGTYSAVSGSIAVAGGVKRARLRNQNGVVLDLRGRQAGFEASLSVSGVTISMR